MVKTLYHHMIGAKEALVNWLTYHFLEGGCNHTIKALAIKEKHSKSNV